MLGLIASEIKTWNNWYAHLFYGKDDVIPPKVQRYLDETTNISVSILQYYYNFPQRYIAKCKNMVRKTGRLDIENFVSKRIGTWSAEAEAFRGSWFQSIAEEILSVKGISIELGDKKERIRAAPKDPAPSCFSFWIESTP